MLIEFAASGSDEAVFIGTFQADGDVGHLQVRSREIFQTLKVPRSYVLREIRLILADSFKMEDSEVDRLGPLGPAASNAPAASPAATTPTAAGAGTPPPAGANMTAKPGAHPTTPGSSTPPPPPAHAPAAIPKARQH